MLPGLLPFFPGFAARASGLPNIIPKIRCFPQLHLGRSRDGEEKGAPLTIPFTFRPDLATMRLNHAFRNRQAQPCAAR